MNCTDCGKEIGIVEKAVLDFKREIFFCWICYEKPENYEKMNV